MKITTKNIGNREMVEIEYSLEDTTIKETLYSAKDILEFISDLNNLQDELFWYLENKIMKTFTLIAHCKSIDTEYQLRHDGEDWKEEAPFEEKTFSTREAALEFAADEKEEITNLVKFEVVEHDCDDK